MGWGLEGWDRGDWGGMLLSIFRVPFLQICAGGGKKYNNVVEGLHYLIAMATGKREKEGWGC